MALSCVLCMRCCAGTHLFILTFSPFDRLWLGENDMAPMHRAVRAQRINYKWINWIQCIPCHIHATKSTLGFSLSERPMVICMTMHRRLWWCCWWFKNRNDKILRLCQNIELFDLLTLHLRNTSWFGENFDFLWASNVFGVRFSKECSKETPLFLVADFLLYKSAI